MNIVNEWDKGKGDRGRSQLNSLGCLFLPHVRNTVKTPVSGHTREADEVSITEADRLRDCGIASLYGILSGRPNSRAICLRDCSFRVLLQSL